MLRLICGRHRLSLHNPSFAPRGPPPPYLPAHDLDPSYGGSFSRTSLTKKKKNPRSLSGFLLFPGPAIDYHHLNSPQNYSAVSIDKVSRRGYSMGLPRSFDCSTTAPGHPPHLISSPEVVTRKKSRLCLRHPRQLLTAGRLPPGPA